MWQRSNKAIDTADSTGKSSVVVGALRCCCSMISPLTTCLRYHQHPRPHQQHRLHHQHQLRQLPTSNNSGVVTTLVWRKPGLGFGFGSPTAKQKKKNKTCSASSSLFLWLFNLHPMGQVEIVPMCSASGGEGAIGGRGGGPTGSRLIFVSIRYLFFGGSVGADAF